MALSAAVATLTVLGVATAAPAGSKATPPPDAAVAVVAPNAASPDQAALDTQIQQARDRFDTTSRDPHPGEPEPLTHPDADHAGSGLEPQTPDRKPPAPQFGPKIAPNSANPTDNQPGLDVSSHQGNVNWAQVQATGAQFAYVKATEATSRANPYFAQQYNGARGAGLVRGAYHFAIPSNSSGSAQADSFVANGGAWSAGTQTMPGMVDLEYNPYGPQCYGLSQGQMVGWIHSFSNEYHARTGRLPVIYTTTDWWKSCTGNSPSFGADPLWIAKWGATPYPLPNGWSNYTIWQYSDHGVYPGGQDSFNGSHAQLVAFANHR
jgi:GH25 family lysozyme M1 (1,4-beta-N-acetylmuramidase)